MMNAGRTAYVAKCLLMLRSLKSKHLYPGLEPAVVGAVSPEFDIGQVFWGIIVWRVLAVDGSDDFGAVRVVVCKFSEPVV